MKWPVCFLHFRKKHSNGTQFVESNFVYSQEMKLEEDLAKNTYFTEGSVMAKYSKKLACAFRFQKYS